MQRAEAYRQLALLKQELLAERTKTGERKTDAHCARARCSSLSAALLCARFSSLTFPVRICVCARPAALSRELYGLKEEFELRDFSDSLRQQSHQIGSAYAPGRRVPTTQRTASVGASSSSPMSGMKASPQEEKEGRSAMYRQSTLQGGARDLSADMAAVRALQEQDRRLTATYGRINPTAGIGMP